MALDTTKTAHELITSGRSTGQTVIDSDGNLKWAIENRTQTDLDNAAEWTLNNLLSSVETGVNANGNKNYLLTEDTTASVIHFLSRLVSVTAGETYTFSAVVKSNGRDASIALGAAFGADLWAFDLTTLATIRLSGTSTTSTAAATALTNGEVLIEFTDTASATANVSTQFRLWDGEADTAYNGDGTSGLYVSEAKVYQSTIGLRELVKNGRDLTNTDNWTAVSDATLSAVAGQLSVQVTTPDDLASAVQAFSTVVGRTYYYTVEKVSQTGNSFWGFSTTSGGGRFVNFPTDEVGVKSGSFVASTETTYVQLWAGNSGADGTTIYDNISVLDTPDAMQRDKFGSNFLENETGAALYGPGIDYSTGRGMLQAYEGRTNLLLNTASLSTQNVTVTATPHTLSFTGTGTVTLSGTSTAGPLVGTGAADTDRVSLTFTPSAGTLTLTVSGSVTFAQLEAGSSASPYIPTNGATVSRGADDLSTLVSSFGYNVNAGTVVVDFVSSGSDGSTAPKAFQFDNGTNNDSTGAGLSTTDNIAANVAVGGVSQAALDGGAYTPEATVKVAFSWAASDFAVSVNGGAVVTDTSGSVPTTTTLRLGMDAAGVNLLNGRVASFVYYPFAASDAQLVEASS